MSRYTSDSPGAIINNTNLTPITGVFGRGMVRYFYANGTFTVPAGVTKVRVRLWGAGGSGSSITQFVGGGGGGFALKVCDVTPQSNIAVTVGTGSVGASGGTSSFGSIFSATGGAGTGGSPSLGGSGVGGDMNFTGGTAFHGNTGSGGSGGGAASLFGDGPPARNNCGGGFGLTASNGVPGQRVSSVYIGGNTYYPTQNPGGSAIPISPISVIPIDYIGTGGGGGSAGGAANSSSGYSYGGNGYNGGGAGGGESSGGAASIPGVAGFPGGGGGCGAGSSYVASAGAAGLVIVEY